MKTLLTVLTVLMLAACSTGYAKDTTVTRSTTMPAMDQNMFKVSHDGFTAMRDIRAARIAIFNGQTGWASKLLTKAINNLNTAAKDDTTYVIHSDTIVSGRVVRDETVSMKKDWIPIDGQIALADTFVPTAENAAYIKKANEHLKKGESKQAIEELRLGAIEVTFSRVLMSLNGTLSKVAEAKRLVMEHKFYEANLVLKTAEDALVVDSVSLIDVPKYKNMNTETKTTK